MLIPDEMKQIAIVSYYSHYFSPCVMSFFAVIRDLIVFPKVLDHTPQLDQRDCVNINRDRAQAVL